jgi:hypothetical protein
VGQRTREIQRAQNPGQAGSPPGDQRELVSLVLAVHPGEGHQRGLGKGARSRSSVTVSLLGAGSVRFGDANEGVRHLRGLKLFVGLKAGVDADDHPEPGQ